MRLFAPLLLLLAGCTSPLRNDQVAATIYSNPPGAVISSGKASGQAPREWTWDTRGLVLVHARWPSGATADQWLNIPMGKRVDVVIQRPQVPGRDIDMKYAATLNPPPEQVSAFAEALRLYNNESTERLRRREVQIAPPVSCTSTVRSSNRIDTDCN